jgi:hypothetical protein
MLRAKSSGTRQESLLACNTEEKGCSKSWFLSISVQLRPALHLTCILLSKEHQNLITEVHYILATTSLKFRARITKL